MTVNWKTLQDRTAECCSGPTTITDPNKTIFDTVYSGLRVNLPDLVQEFPPGGGSTLTVYADTVVVDYPTFDASGVVVVARCLDLSQLAGAALPIRVPQDNPQRMLQFLVKETIGGPLKLTTDAAQPGAPTEIPTGDSPLTAALFAVMQDGAVSEAGQRGGQFVSKDVRHVERPDQCRQRGGQRADGRGGEFTSQCQGAAKDVQAAQGADFGNLMKKLKLIVAENKWKALATYASQQFANPALAGVWKSISPTPAYR